MMNLPYKERCLAIAMKWEYKFNTTSLSGEEHKAFHKDLEDNKVSALDVFKYMEDYCNI